MRTHFTNKQIKVNNWINEIGFQTEMEKVFGKYCVDIYIPELNWVIELDGFGHWAKKDEKRDNYLYSEFKISYIIHLTDYNKLTKGVLEQIIKMAVERKYGKGEIEKGNSTNKG